MDILSANKGHFFHSFFLIIATILSNTLYGQVKPGIIDSFKLAIKNAKTDTDKVNDLVAFSKITDCRDSLLKISYGNEALQLAEKIHWRVGIVKADISLGITFEDCVKNGKISIRYYLNALSVAKSLGNKLKQAEILGRTANIYNEGSQYRLALDYYKQILALNTGQDQELAALGNMGVIYNYLADFPNALACYDSSLKKLERSLRTTKKGDEIDTLQMGGLLIVIGDIYLTTKEYDRSFTNYNNALQLSEQTKNKSLAMLALTGIGKTFLAQKYYLKTIEYFNRALEYSREINDRKSEAGILNQLGKVYLENGTAKEAMGYIQQSLQIAEENNYTNWISENYKTLGKIYTQLRQYPKAIDYLKKAISICKQTGTMDIEKDALEALSKAYEAAKQPALALVTYRDFIAIRDSIYSQEKARQMTRTEMQGDFDRKALADSLVQAKKDVATGQHLQQQRMTIYAGFAGLGLVLVLSFFIYRNYSNEKKSNRLITEEKENAERQRLRAERSEQFEQQFLANMSHEIRTPMNAVSGLTDLLLDQNPRPDQVNYLQVISKSSDILLHIINDILDLSKIQAGKLELEQIDFSLADTVQLVKDTLSVKAEEKGLQLLTHIDKDVADVLQGDPYRINQVLMNLGSNAVKFTERGGVYFDVNKVGEDSDHVTLRFSVTDTGIGIPEDKQKAMFESFKQVNNSDTRNYGGTGLGLSVSKLLVELHGGTLSAESKEGKGTVFSFVITYLKGSAEKLRQRIQQEQGISAKALDGLRILLAEDNEYNRLVVHETLCLKADVHLDMAVNGEEAIAMLRQNDYDVVLMDVQMPVMSGIEATRYIRAHLPDSKKNIPVIALTASILRADLERCLDASMNAYLPKPFKAWQLVLAIADVTGRKGGAGAAPLADAGTPGGTLPATNMAYLAKYCEGEEDRMHAYIQLYLDAVPSFREKITSAITTGEVGGIAELMHSFKPKWSMMGMKTALQLGITIEQQCREGDTNIKEQARLLLAEADKSVRELGNAV